ncbi:MAG: hypothetical protein M3O71_25845 [Bacteroidota bacterium]|nr:hypothetical protein [Bacteroidota bacterium]
MNKASLLYFAGALLIGLVLGFVLKQPIFGVAIGTALGLILVRKERNKMVK